MLESKLEYRTFLLLLAVVTIAFAWLLLPFYGAVFWGTILAIIFVLLAAKTFGWLFYNATNVNFINWFYGYTTTDPAVPIWSYPPLIASYLIDNTIFQIGMVVLFGAWFLGWSGTLFLSSTRMIFAAAFDRILPERAAQVSENRGVPITALLFIMVPAIVVSVIYAFSADFRALTLDATLVIAVTFLGSTIAATILPWWKPQIFDSSPIAHLKVVISVCSLIISLILAYVIYLWLSDPLYGIGVGNANSIIFLGILYGLAAVVYVAARIYRRSQGVDLDAIHAEIPAE